MRAKTIINDADLDGDFEYNFDVSPFSYLLDGIHWLVTTPYHLATRLFRSMTNRLHTIQKEKGWRRTFKGPSCSLR
jgi:hypothetical protein